MLTKIQKNYLEKVKTKEKAKKQRQNMKRFQQRHKKAKKPEPQTVDERQTKFTEIRKAKKYLKHLGDLAKIYPEALDFKLLTSIIKSYLEQDYYKITAKDLETYRLPKSMGRKRLTKKHYMIANNDPREDNGAPMKKDLQVSFIYNLLLMIHQQLLKKNELFPQTYKAIVVGEKPFRLQAASSFDAWWSKEAQKEYPMIDINEYPFHKVTQEEKEKAERADRKKASLEGILQDDPDPKHILLLRY